MDIQTEMNQMYGQLGISAQVLEYGRRVEETLKERFEVIDRTAEYNQMKVIKGMQDNRVSDIHFAATTGYGYNDLGRDTLEDVYASVFHGESALVRPQLISGTHALHVALSRQPPPRRRAAFPGGKTLRHSGGGDRHPRFRGLLKRVWRRLPPGGFKARRHL